MIIVTCTLFADFLETVGKSTFIKKGTVEFVLTKDENNFSILSVNLVRLAVWAKTENDLKFDVPIQYVRNLRDYLRTVPEQPLKISFANNVITPILECPTPCCFI